MVHEMTRPHALRSLLKIVAIGVIYGDTKSTGTPSLWTERYSTPTFHDKTVKNCLSSAVNRSDLRRLNYNKTISACSLPGPHWESSQRSPRPQSRMRRGNTIFFPILPPFCLRAQGRLVLFLNWHPHFLDQSYDPDRNLLRDKPRSLIIYKV